MTSFRVTGVQIGALRDHLNDKFCLISGKCTQGQVFMVGSEQMLRC